MIVMFSIWKLKFVANVFCYTPYGLMAFFPFFFLCFFLLVFTSLLFFTYNVFWLTDCLSVFQLFIIHIFSNSYCWIQPCIPESKITQWLIALIALLSFTLQSLHSRVGPWRLSTAVRLSVFHNPPTMRLVRQHVRQPETQIFLVHPTADATASLTPFSTCGLNGCDRVSKLHITPRFSSFLSHATWLITHCVGWLVQPTWLVG